MNAIEIEEAISALAERPFDLDEFPFEFLQAFGHKETTIKKLRKGTTNKSDLGGVLNNHATNIHIVVCEEGKVAETLDRIKTSPATIKAKTKFALATDGLMLRICLQESAWSANTRIFQITSAFSSRWPAYQL